MSFEQLHGIADVVGIDDIEDDRETNVIGTLERETPEHIQRFTRFVELRDKAESEPKPRMGVFGEAAPTGKGEEGMHLSGEERVELNELRSEFEAESVLSQRIGDVSLGDVAQQAGILATSGPLGLGIHHAKEQPSIQLTGIRAVQLLLGAAGNLAKIQKWEPTKQAQAFLVGGLPGSLAYNLKIKDSKAERALDEGLLRIATFTQQTNQDMEGFADHLNKEMYEAAGGGAAGQATVFAANYGATLATMALRMKSLEIMYGFQYGQTAVSAASSSKALTFAQKMGMVSKKTHDFLGSQEKTKLAWDSALKAAKTSTGKAAFSRLIGGLKSAGPMTLMNPMEGTEFDPHAFAKSYARTAAFLTTPAYSGLFTGKLAPFVDVLANNIWSVALGEYKDAWTGTKAEGERIGMTDAQSDFHALTVGLGRVFAINAIFGLKTLSIGTEHTRMAVRAGKLAHQFDIQNRDSAQVKQMVHQYAEGSKAAEVADRETRIEQIERDKTITEPERESQVKALRDEIATYRAMSPDDALDLLVARLNAEPGKDAVKLAEDLQKKLFESSQVKAKAAENLEKLIVKNEAEIGRVKKLDAQSPLDALKDVKLLRQYESNESASIYQRFQERFAKDTETMALLTTRLIDKKDVKRGKDISDDVDRLQKEQKSQASEYNNMLRPWKRDVLRRYTQHLEREIAESKERMETMEHDASELARNVLILNELVPVAKKSAKHGAELAEAQARIAEVSDADAIASLEKKPTTFDEVGRVQKDAYAVIAEFYDKAQSEGIRDEVATYDRVIELVRSGDGSQRLDDEVRDWILERLVEEREERAAIVEEGRGTEPERTAETQAARPDAEPAKEAAAAKPPEEAKPPHRLKTFVDEIRSIYKAKDDIHRDRLFDMALKSLSENSPVTRERIVKNGEFIRKEIEDIAVERFSQIHGKTPLTDAENLLIAKAEHARQAGEQPPDMSKKVADIVEARRDFFERIYEVVNAVRVANGMEPLPKIDQYAPLFRDGQISGDYSPAGEKTVDDLFDFWRDPASFYRRGKIKDFEFYQKDAQKTFMDYERMMLGWLALQRNNLPHGELSDMVAREMNMREAGSNINIDIDSLRDQLNSLAVIHARSDWHKAQAEGREATTSSEKYGEQIEKDFQGMKDALAEMGLHPSEFKMMESDMVDVVAAFDNYRGSNGFGRRVNYFSVETTNPWLLHSHFDGQWRKGQEIGPNWKTWWKMQQDEVDRLHISKVKKEDVLHEIERIFGKGSSDWWRRKRVNSRLTVIDEFRQDTKMNTDRFSNADLADIISRQENADISSKDVQLYRSTMNLLERFVEENRDKIDAMRGVKDIAFRSPYFRQFKKKAWRAIAEKAADVVGEASDAHLAVRARTRLKGVSEVGFLQKVSGIIDKTALAAKHSDNIRIGLALEDYYKNLTGNANSSENAMGEWWGRYVREGLAHGLHPSDKIIAGKGGQRSLRQIRLDNQKDETESGKKEGFWRRNRSSIGEGTLDVMGLGNEYISTRYLLGNIAWNLTRQTLSFGNIIMSHGLHRFAQGMGDLAMAKLWTELVVDHTALRDTKYGQNLLAKNKEALHWTESTVHELKNMSKAGMAGAALEGRRADLQQGIYSHVKGFGFKLGNVVENMMGAAAYYTALADGRARGMSGDRLDMYANTAVAVTQSMYNRESRALLLNSTVWRFIMPFSTYALDTASLVRSDIFTTADVKAQERAMHMLWVGVGLGLMTYVSETFYKRKATDIPDVMMPGLNLITRWFDQRAPSIFATSDPEASRGEEVAGSIADTTLRTVGTAFPSIGSVLPAGRAMADYMRSGGDDTDGLIREFPAAILAMTGIGFSEQWKKGIQFRQAYVNHGYMPYKEPYRQSYPVIDNSTFMSLFWDFTHSQFLRSLRNTPTALKAEEIKKERGFRR